MIICNCPIATCSLSHTSLKEGECSYRLTEPCVANIAMLYVVYENRPKRYISVIFQEIHYRIVNENRPQRQILAFQEMRFEILTEVT